MDSTELPITRVIVAPLSYPDLHLIHSSQNGGAYVRTALGHDPHALGENCIILEYHYINDDQNLTYGKETPWE